MKKFYYLLGFLALTLTTSCQKDEYLLEVAQPETNPVVTASIETAVRTQLDVIDGAYKTIWSADDAISFIYRNKHYKYDLAEGGEGNVTQISSTTHSLALSAEASRAPLTANSLLVFTHSQPRQRLPRAVMTSL